MERILTVYLKLKKLYVHKASILVKNDPLKTGINGTKRHKNPLN